VPASRRDCGLALAGALPIEGAPRVRHFRRHAGPDRLKRKGVLSARVELGGGLEIAVHVTHLQAGRARSAVRSLQIDELLDEIDREASPAVLMGDFNFHAEDAGDARSEARLGDAGFSDAARDAAAPTFTSRNRYVRHRHCHERFDRVFLRSGGGVRLRPIHAEVLDRITPLSDHHPVRVRVRVEG
jgi:endonuclease/exonuclease/phosphatase family metal-dependent hydrolase